MNKVIHVTCYLDGGTAVVLLDNKKRFYVDGRRGPTRGEVFDSYPDGGKVVSKTDLWELIVALKSYEDIPMKNHIFGLLATA